MKRSLKSLFVIIILMLVFAAISPIPALAAPSVLTVNPAQVVNNIDTIITITGTGFDSTAKVSVGTNIVVSTFQSATRIQATIPSGFNPGTYDVTVTNDGQDPSTLIQGLTVVSAPTATLSFRPLIVIDSYSLSVAAIRYGQDFTLNLSLDNAGGSTAVGMQVTFISTDVLMLYNGGVIAPGSLGTVGKANVGQTMTLSPSLQGVSHASVEMDVSYFDEKGTAYTDKFALSMPVASTYVAWTPGPTKTPTPGPVSYSQLVVTDYHSDADPLKPGGQFTLSMTVQNNGNAAAKSITMIIGGGSSGTGSGTPQAGISAGSGEFTTFAPVGSSNIQSLGDLAPGATLTATQMLVVNVSTSPGAYPMRVTFSYQDSHGNPVNDAQVITLLVYDLPNIDVSFYQPVGILTAGQPNTLPLQVVSLGKHNVVLGKMTVTTDGGTIDNGEGLVGSLDPGGYFTLDAMVTPNSAGPLTLTITIEYTDDFNQVRTITKTLGVDVNDMSMLPTPDASGGDGSGTVVVGPTTETFWQKVWRFILGLFGLDSSSTVSTPVPESPTEFPVPLPGGGKG